MIDMWFTTGNYNSRDIANPIFAAYDKEVYPRNVHILATSTTSDQVGNARSVLDTLREEDGRKMEVEVHKTPDRPREFKAHASELFNEVTDSTVALDITGRPSIYGSLLLQQAIKDNVDADHVYHLDYLVPPHTLDTELYPSIPQTAVKLTDILSDFTTEGNDD
ncbi:hypothetical protein [Salinibaculum salinum]|uniref:hypothetical protein n=1 Tax=Salinibaculum salinum TaxID=3131996 RepID=UPI0030ED2720